MHLGAWFRTFRIKLVSLVCAQSLWADWASPAQPVLFHLHGMATLTQLYSGRTNLHAMSLAFFQAVSTAFVYSIFTGRFSSCMCATSDMLHVMS